MKLPRLARTFSPILLSVLLTMAAVQPAAAFTLGERSYSTAHYSATVFAPFWSGQGHYSLRWRQALSPDEGRLVASKLELSLHVHGGGTCLTTGGSNAVCKAFTLAPKVEFLNSSGTVVQTINSSSFGTSTCWGHIYPAGDHVSSRCASGGYSVSTSARKIRFTMEGFVVNRSNNVASFSKQVRTFDL